MNRLLLTIFSCVLLVPLAHAEDLPHLNLDLPRTVEDLEARMASADAHITPKADLRDAARADYLATIESALAARSDAWFTDPTEATGLREACVALAHLYLDETRTLVDEPLAYALSVIACEGGSDAGCELFVDQDWRYHLIETEHLFPARDHFQWTCAEGHAEHCDRLAQLISGLRENDDNPRDDETGRAHYRLACDLGATEACDRVREPQLSHEERFTEALERCEGGEARRCHSVGYSYVTGYGTRQGVAAGLNYLTRACDAGNQPSCAFIARIYDQGLGVEADPALARRWHDKACTTGVRESCEHLERDCQVVCLFGLA